MKIPIYYLSDCRKEMWNRSFEVEQLIYVSSRTLRLTSADLICVRGNLVAGTG